jgi:hypothetical protein
LLLLYGLPTEVEFLLLHSRQPLLKDHLAGAQVVETEHLRRIGVDEPFALAQDRLPPLP